MTCIKMYTSYIRWYNIICSVTGQALALRNSCISNPALDEGHDEETEDSMKEHRGFIKWARAHKKALAIAGFTLGGLIALILGIKNKDSLVALWASLKKSIEPSAKATAKRVIVHTPKVTPTPPRIDPVQPITKVVQPAVENASAVTHRLSTVPFEVDPHIRELHPGWRASAKKIATAAEHGFVLKEGQTWVEAYVKGGVAA